MYILISEETMRQHRGELVHEVSMARWAKEERAGSDANFRTLRNLRWELARYMGLVGKRLRNSGTPNEIPARRGE